MLEIFKNKILGEKITPIEEKVSEQQFCQVSEAKRDWSLAEKETFCAN